MRKNIIIFGPGDFGQVAYFYLMNDSEFNVVAFTAHRDKIKDEKLFNIPIIPFEEIEEKFPPEKYGMFIAVPYTNLNRIRAKIFDDAKQKGYELISYINSKAIIWNDINIGENCFILENNVIQPFVTIGDDVIIWSGNHIGHHTIIKDHCFLASHVVISGKVVIEPFCFLGVNSTIRDGIHIEKNNVIGAGAVILKNTKENQVYSTNYTKLLDINSEDLKFI
ncbi:acetyltransferase [Nitrosopumilus sp. K4]|uniref:acetyltransferase n=1 Tax=Nitrosopumilus sp. K4 TaxID=2795383 RepID=UPI001BAB7D03|nr:acetyltransferase [Nitrosopumilus sp. K4]QUC64454.1 acetyltransferase [Nitrosopumilus sp. K4]